MKLLLVEDERAIAEAVEHVLRKHNYAVDLAFDGESGLDEALTGAHDLIVLDIMLPKRDGLSVLREIRAEGLATPVLLLTARAQVEDRVSGLDAGADDYLTKPFHADELLARLRALGRRGGDLVPDGVLRLGGTSLNPHTLALQAPGGEIALTRKEAQLLEMLLKRQGRTANKEAIIEKLWGYDADAEDGHVDTHMSLLRKKLASVQADVRIRTIRGLGYVLEGEG